MFHCHFLFFFDKCSISKLISLFLGKMLKLVISDYEFFGRASFITRDNLDRPNCDSDGKARNMRQRTVVWLIYHQSEFQKEVIFVNFLALKRLSLVSEFKWPLLSARRVVFFFCNWLSQWFDLRAPSSTEVPVRMLNQPINPATTPGRPGN